MSDPGSEETAFSEAEETGPIVYWLRPGHHNGDRTNMFSVSGTYQDAVGWALRLIDDRLASTRFVDVYQETMWGEHLDFVTRIKPTEAGAFAEDSGRPI